MSKATTQFDAWSVRVRDRRPAVGSGSRTFLAGRYYFNPKAETACRVALFETRSEARAAAKGGWEKLVREPVRVRVTVETIEEDQTK